MEDHVPTATLTLPWNQSTSTVLPTYTSRQPGPPAYHLSPTTLLSPVWLRQHLLLLAAFSRLKHVIQALDFGDNRAAEGKDTQDTQACLRDLDESGRWGLFTEMAARRFGIWQVKYIAEGIAELPPLDVLMVWCAYLGSPGWYKEDSVRLAPFHPGILFPDFPLDSVAKVINPRNLIYDPGNSAATRWKTSTGLLFDPVEAFKTSHQVTVECPKCDDTFSVSWLTDTGSGYGQQGFKTRCCSCRTIVTKEAIAIRRLINELKKLFLITSSRLAFYLLTPSPVSSRVHPLAGVINRLGDSIADIGDRWNWSSQMAFYDLTFNHVDIEKPVARLMSAYVGAERASVDLVAATLRHTVFVDKLQELGWLDPSRWDQRAETLDKAIARYTRFLQLARELPKRMLVPTIGIDIAWQTHLLLASLYRRDMKIYVGQLFDREDAVEQGVLSAAFDDTAQRWQACFKVLYSTSGHLPPNESALSKISSRLHLSSMPLTFASINYDLPLIYDEVDSFLSHPSERSSIFLANDERALKARSRRESEFRDRLTNSLKKAGKGLADASLIERAKATRPAFVTDDIHWRRFGPCGFPVTAMGIIASANVLDARVVYSPVAAGIGVVGAGFV